MRGHFFWYDIMTTDVAAARKFYGEVMGWDSHLANSPAAEYFVFTREGHGVAGLMALPPDACAAGARSTWTGYIAVADVDDAANRLAQSGGTIHHPPTEVPGVIRFAVVADPQGARFVIAKGLEESASPALPPGTPGTVGWRELYAVDWQSAWGFYELLFGWTQGEAIDMGGMGTYQIFAIEGAMAGGMMNKPETVPMAHWGYYFNTPAIDAAVARVNSAGGAILNGPHQVPGGQWIVNCADPQGAFFSLVAPHP